MANSSCLAEDALERMGLLSFCVDYSLSLTLNFLIFLTLFFFTETLSLYLIHPRKSLTALVQLHFIYAKKLMGLIRLTQIRFCQCVAGLVQREVDQIYDFSISFLTLLTDALNPPFS